MDILDRLTRIAELKSGDEIPPEFKDSSGSWAKGMSDMLFDAIREIKSLRDFRQASIKALAAAYKPDLRPGTACGDVNPVPYKELVKSEPWGSSFAMNFGEKK